MNLKQPTPPVFFIFSVCLMLMADRYLPGFRIFTGESAYMLGIMFMCFGLGMVLSSIVTLRKAGTTIKPWAESSVLVKSGPYSYCRNPIYLGMVLILFGLFFFTGSSMSLMVVFLFGGIIEDRFIRPEEIKLSKKFGKEYTEYTFKVSKWFPMLTEFAYEKRKKGK
jgi:protein-S-isoprenylcysteine O-methyltransferase Ste14